MSNRNRKRWASMREISQNRTIREIAQEKGLSAYEERELKNNTRVPSSFLYINDNVKDEAEKIINKRK